MSACPARLLSLVSILPIVVVGCVADVPGSGQPPAGGAPVVDDRCGTSDGVAVGFPLRPGDYTIGQGNGGAFSHTGVNTYGFDFTVPVGTDVIAARGGTVAFVVDGFGEGGPDATLAPEANVVVVDHGGGTFDSYFHLAAGTIAVAVGDIVTGGQFLASSGNSGFTSAPHLHFAVVDATMQSLPSCFMPDELVPETDDVVTAVASPLADPAAFPRSLLDDDTFEDEGVVIDNDVVAFTADGVIHVEGRVTDGENRVALYLAPYAGGTAIAQVVVVVDESDGSFVADLDVSAVSGPQSFGLSSVTDAGAFGGRTVPMFIE